MSSLTTPRVQIIEVGPRDGLQNEAAVLPTADKLELVRRVVAAGVRRVEVASFVSPTRVPQMADAEAVCAGLPRSRDVAYIGLVLNRRGLERALVAGLDEVNVVVVATDEFSRRNQGVTTKEMLAFVGEAGPSVRAAGMRFGATIAAAFGCPFTGEVPLEDVTGVARELVEIGVEELALADTIGVAVPTQVQELVGAVRELRDDLPLRAHFHNTRNTGYANAVAAIDAGVTVLDASVGGFGGCPFAPAATGNIATEDLAWMLSRMGLDTGADAIGLAETAAWLGERLGRRAPGLLGHAGGFPPAP